MSACLFKINKINTKIITRRWFRFWHFQTLHSTHAADDSVCCFKKTIWLMTFVIKLLSELRSSVEFSCPYRNFTFIFYFWRVFFSVFQHQTPYEINVKLIWPSWLVLGSASGAYTAPSCKQKTTSASRLV